MQDLAEARLRNDPFAASYLGVSGYDDAVPDLSPQAQRAWRDRLVDVVARCEQLEADVENLDSRVLLAAPCVMMRHAGWPWPTRASRNLASRPCPWVGRR